MDIDTISPNSEILTGEALKQAILTRTAEVVGAGEVTSIMTQALVANIDQIVNSAD